MSIWLTAAGRFSFEDYRNKNASPYLSACCTCVWVCIYACMCFPADQATLGLMKTPRCSLPDVSEPEMSAGRRKRALAPQNKWNKRHLSWRYIHHIWVWNWVIAVRQLYMLEMHSIHLNSKHRGIVASLIVRADGKSQN